jgi:thiol-disulfide isomerase/thioredoxin
MRKIAILLAFVLMLCLCGCESEKTSISTTQPTDSVDVGFALGQKMPDLTVTTSDGQERNVSQLLREKELVVLNFWFENCSWCQKEFPAMELGYQQYKDHVEILAVNPVDGGENISAFAESSSYSFPMASCSRDLALAFGIGGYPTSVFIDREGRISLIHAGAITDSNVFYQVFEHYTSEDYVSKSYVSIAEILE